MIVGNDRSHLASVFDLETFETQAPILFQDGYPRSIAVAHGGIWATVRVVSPPDFIEEVGPPLPDLRFTLSQPAATLWADAEQTEILQETNLRFGRELILKSRPPSSSPPSPLSQTRDSVLFITPAVSPP